VRRQEEEGDGEVPLNTEPTNWAELDPKSMKVAELKQELELRTLSPKGLKSQLIARLTKVLKTEEEKEEEDKASGAAAAAAKPTPPPQPVQPAPEPESQEDEETKRREEAERRSLEKKYALPDAPHVIVHPHRTAKSGKFDCTVMSLSVLLDYRSEDNKEHSFEVSLFAEVFNEMLMRDAGFTIYRALVDAPEKVKEDKKKKEEKDKEEKKEKEGEEDKKKEEGKKDEEKEEKVEEEQASGDANLYTANKALLMSFAYFDTSHCGYIIDKDLEEILYTVGLSVSRAQTRKLVARVAEKDSVQYRQLTDRPVPEDGEEETPDPSKHADIAVLAKGNYQYLPNFGTGVAAGTTASAAASAGEDKQPVMVQFEGSLVDLASLMSRVRRSDSTLQQTERRMCQLQEEAAAARHEAADLRAQTSRQDEQLEVSRAQVANLERELSGSRETVGKYGTALDACYAAVAPLVAEAESRAEQAKQDAEKAEADQAVAMDEDSGSEARDSSTAAAGDAGDDSKPAAKTEGKTADAAEGKTKEKSPRKRARSDTKDPTPKKAKAEVKEEKENGEAKA